MKPLMQCKDSISKTAPKQSMLYGTAMALHVACTCNQPKCLTAAGVCVVGAPSQVANRIWAGATNSWVGPVVHSRRGDAAPASPSAGVLVVRVNAGCGQRRRGRLAWRVGSNLLL